MLHSYLILSDYIQPFEEEQKIAALCLRYLTFKCFDPELYEDEIQAYLLSGSYAFLDYAVLHWADHVESVMQNQNLKNLDTQLDFGPAIEAFCNTYGGDVGNEDTSQDINTESHYGGFQDAKYFETTVRLLANERKSRKNNLSPMALGQLGKMVAKIRTKLERLAHSNLNEDLKLKLRDYYGENWYKCPYSTCSHFHEGFSFISQRDDHVNRHDRPFLCTEIACPAGNFGFGSDSDLKRHMKVYHPSPPKDIEMDLTADEMSVENEISIGSKGAEEVLAAFGSLTRSTKLKRLEADVGIKTRLLP